MNIAEDIKKRVEWIKRVLEEAHAKGIVLGMSGGKDCALVGILAKQATPNVTGIIMPCESDVNYTTDRDDALALNNQFGIKSVEVDLTNVKKAFREVLEPISESQYRLAYENINPRLRMITLYNYAQREGYLVAGTGNRSERTIGYFTKWGDGAYDFNPIGDLTVREVYEYLRVLGAPQSIIDKAPSAGLYPGQTDEKDLGLKYSDIDEYILTGNVNKETGEKIAGMCKKTEHKKQMGKIYPD